MSVNDLAQDQFASIRTVEAIRGEIFRDSEEIVLGHVDFPFREKPMMAVTAYDEISDGLVVTGDTGLGRTTLLCNISLQYIHDGCGCCYVGFGESRDLLLSRIPQDRLDDVSIIGESSRSDSITGFDLFEPYGDRFEVSDSLIYSLYWSTESGNFSSSSLIALRAACSIANAAGKSPTELHTVFQMSEEDIKDLGIEITHNIKEYVVELDSTSETIAPILNKFNRFADSATLSAMFDPQGVSIEDAVKNDKIVIVSPPVDASTEERQTIVNMVMAKFYDVFYQLDCEGLSKWYPFVIDDFEKYPPQPNLVRCYMRYPQLRKTPFMLSTQSLGYLHQLDEDYGFSDIPNWISFRQTSDIASGEWVQSQLGVSDHVELRDIQPCQSLCRVNGVNGEYAGKLHPFPPLKPVRNLGGD